jgi:hypothetical protein
MKWAFIGLSIAGLLIMTKETKSQQVSAQSQPRGIRNNNPLNIRYSAANNWQGQTGTDGEYAIFDEPENGIRAAAKLLNRYITVYGLVSVSGIISRWAPATENNTQSYISAVSNKLEVLENEPILWPTQAQELIKAMIHHENGVQPYSNETINEGIKRAGL